MPDRLLHPRINISQDSLHEQTNMINSLYILLCASCVYGIAPSGPWDAFNYAPKSKTVYPTAIYHSEGSIENPENLVNNTASATISGEGSWVALDFGVEASLLHNVPLAYDA